MDIFLDASCATQAVAPRLYRRGDGHLGLQCGPFRRRKLKVWMLLRLRYGFQPRAGDDGRLLVWGEIRLRVLETPGLMLVSDSDVGDVLLRVLCGEV